MESNYRRAFEQVIYFLEQLEDDKKIKYYLVGGILVNIYSDLRTTLDIDLAIDLHSSELNYKEYIQLLEKSNFYPYQDWETTTILAKESNIIQFLDKTETIRYDNHLIIRDSQNKYKKMGVIGLKRRLRREIFGIECWVCSKEDFILSKLIFGGWQDYADALGCWMRFSGELDIKYLEESSRILKVSKEYRLLLSGIDDPDEYFEKLDRK